jgi:hypothetical protein
VQMVIFQKEFKWFILVTFTESNPKYSEIPLECLSENKQV